MRSGPCHLHLGLHHLHLGLLDLVQYGQAGHGLEMEPEQLDLGLLELELLELELLELELLGLEEEKEE